MLTSSLALVVGKVATMAVGSRQKFRLLDYLHCPAFLRLSIVCRHPEVQAFPAANCGPRFWHALVQALTSQLTAAARADGAETCAEIGRFMVAASENMPRRIRRHSHQREVLTNG